VFVDIAAHNDIWPKCDIEQYSEMDSSYIQYLLSLGLETLHQLFTAKSYEERYALLSDVCPPRIYLPEFLYLGLRYCANESDVTIWLNELTADEIAIYIKSPFFPDPDIGPRHIWQWAHWEESWTTYVFQENRQDLREWGYVMWDRSRLDDSGIFQKPWEDLPLEEDEVTSRRARMQNGWELIYQLHSQADTGQWIWEDECQRKLRREKSPSEERVIKPSPPIRLEPKSLQEAREMLEAMRW
jgi:hypothetical protein